MKKGFWVTVVITVTATIVATVLTVLFWDKIPKEEIFKGDYGPSWEVSRGWFIPFIPVGGFIIWHLFMVLVVKTESKVDDIALANVIIIVLATSYPISWGLITTVAVWFMIFFTRLDPPSKYYNQAEDPVLRPATFFFGSLVVIAATLPLKWGLVDWIF